MNREDAVYCVLLNQEERETVIFELEVICRSIKVDHEVEWLQKGDERPAEGTTAAEPSPAYRVDDCDNDEADDDEEEYEDFIMFMSSSIGSKLAAYKLDTRFGLLFLDWYETSWLIDHLQIALDAYAMENEASKESNANSLQMQSLPTGISAAVYFASNVASVRAKLVEAFARGA